MICVTGAGGTVGREVVTQLESAKAPFRAAYFSNEKAEAARARGMDAVILDYNRPSKTTRSALKHEECGPDRDSLGTVALYARSQVGADAQRPGNERVW
jgi:hypothetical protein